MEHTSEFLAAMFGAYIGSETCIDASNHGNGATHTLYRAMTGVTGTKASLVHFVDGIEEIDKCQIILTPLPEITEEDAIEVAKIAGCKMEDAYESDSDRQFIEKDEWGNIVLYFWHSTSSETDEADVFPFTITTTGECYDYMGTSVNQIAITDYLRSSKRPDGTDKPSYDCGFRHIPSLIDAGLAVKYEKP